MFNGFDRIARSPIRTASNTVGILTIAGGVILVALAYEIVVLNLSMAALATQVVAMLLAIAYRLWRLSARFLIYPAILFATIYLWDSNLPPPSLPEGTLRVLVPLIVIGALIVDLVLTHTRHTKRYTSKRSGITVTGGYVGLEEAARFFNLAPHDLRSRLEHARTDWVVGMDGYEYVALTDVLYALDNRENSVNTES
jgi:hypothetical protein